MTRPLLLDTCALVWIAAGETIGDAARAAVEAAAEAADGLAVSPITTWEIGLLVSRGRLTLTASPHAWVDAILARPEVALAGLSPDILIASSFLPGAPPCDPADRIIIATARAHRMRVVTRDRLILAYAEAGHVEAIAC